MGRFPSFLEVAKRTNYSEDRGLKVRFSLATIAFETFELILCQMLSSQGKDAPSNPYRDYLVRLATSRLMGRFPILMGRFPEFLSAQRAPNPPESAQPRLSRSNGGHPQREGTNLGVFVPKHGWSYPGVQRTPWGWKTSRMTPLPKMGFGSPLARYVFHPPQVSVLCFSCTKITTTEQTRSSFGGVRKFLRESAFSGPRCEDSEATDVGVFDLCRFAPLKLGCANLGGFGARWTVRLPPSWKSSGKQPVNQKRASDPPPPHIRQKYEQKSGQNMTPKCFKTRRPRQFFCGHIFVHILALYVGVGVSKWFPCINQRAENGGLDPSWLGFAFLGRPDFQSRGSKYLFEGF